MNGCGVIVRGEAAEDTGVDTAAAAFGTADLVWVHLDGRKADALAWLSKQEDIPAIVRESLVAAETRPRTDVIAQGALINLRGLAETGADDGGDALVSIRCWVEKGRVISVTFRRLGALPEVRRQAAEGQFRDPGDLIAGFAVAITRALDPEVAALGDLLDDCEARLAPETGFAMRREMGRARARAIGYRRFVAPQRQALERLAGLDVDWLEETDRLHLRNAADRFARMAEELEAVRERAALMHEQLTDLRAEQIESRSLLIAIVALVFLPLTFITGLLGMNVEGIPFAHEPWAFAGVTALCLVVALGVVGLFAAKRWFRS